MAKKCNGCVQEPEQASIPFIVHEKEMARKDRTETRLWILIILLVVLLVGTNGAWLWYESQFETIEYSEAYDVSAEDGGNAIVNGDGSVNINGEH